MHIITENILKSDGLERKQYHKKKRKRRWANMY